MAAGSKAGVIQRAIDDVCREQTAEKEHLGGEKDPHAEIAGVVLLFEIVKLVVQRGAAPAGRRQRGVVGGGVRHARALARRSRRVLR